LASDQRGKPDERTAGSKIRNLGAERPEEGAKRQRRTTPKMSAILLDLL
jgi:hypothetical protein